MQELVCQCCGLPFPEGEGYLGDICDRCGWEVDTLEDVVCDGITCCDWSAANHAYLSDWYATYQRKRPANKN